MTEAPENAHEDVFGLVGTAIDGRFRVDEHVAAGGFGVVYKGFHLSLERPVAIKCLFVPNHVRFEELEPRLRAEAHLMSRLHELRSAIVQVFDQGVTTGASGARVPYFVMEWLEGSNLADALDTRRLLQLPPYTERAAITLLRTAVDAIAAGHAEQPAIVHRDLKPTNLFLLRDERSATLKVLDFGIAKVMQPGDSVTHARTGTRGSPFTAAYAAPEQLLAGQEHFGATGPWTDVYAFGLLLVELVTGRPVLDLALSEERPTPRVRGVQVSDAFEAVCAKALALAPRERYRDAGELLEALDAVLAGSQEQQVVAAAPELVAGDSPRVWTRPRVWGVAALTLVAAGGVAALWPVPNTPADPATLREAATSVAPALEPARTSIAQWVEHGSVPQLASPDAGAPGEAAAPANEAVTVPTKHGPRARVAKKAATVDAQPRVVAQAPPASAEVTAVEESLAEARQKLAACAKHQFAFLRDACIEKQTHELESKQRVYELVVPSHRR